MLDFAVQLTQAPEACGEEAVEALRQTGYNDQDILHSVELTALFKYNVRLATATGLIPNPEYHTLGREPAQSP